MQAKYTEHPVFKKPTNENAKIWRYMDFTKFVSLLETNTLFFSRSDKLGDKFEGSYPRANIELRPKLYDQSKSDRAPLEDFLRIRSIFSEKIRHLVFINCWNLSECESAALWKLYLKTDEGIAIQSTFKRLTESFSSNAEKSVYIGKVAYIDYNTDLLSEENALYPFLYKRKSFEHEQELRAITIFATELIDDPTSAVLDIDIDLTGEYINVDLERLIEKVFVAPTAQEWFADLVSSIMHRYAQRKELVRSDLASDPVY